MAMIFYWFFNKYIYDSNGLPVTGCLVKVV